MTVMNLGNPSSYKEAGDALFDQLDLNNVQMSDYNNFIRNILPIYLNQPIIHDKFILTFSNWFLDDSELLSEDVCKETGKSRELVVRATARLKMNKMEVGGELKFPPNSVITFPIQLTKIPLLTEKGSFLVKGVNRVMVSHLERSNTLQKLKEPNGEKAVAFTTSSRAVFIIAMEKGQPICKMNAGPGASIVRSGKKHKRLPPVSLSGLLHSLGVDTADDIRKIVGVNPYLHGIENIPGKKDNYMQIIGRIRLNMSERVLLNKKLSFRTRLSGKTLDEDVMAGELFLKKGTVVTPEQASKLQELGVTSVVIKIPGGNINVINNGFLSPESHIKEKDMIPTIRRWDVTTAGDELVQDGYHEISKDELDKVMKECNINSLEVKEQLTLHQHSLLGTNLTRQDVIAIVNLFSYYLMDLEKEDDKDSLSNKSLVNISTIFEDILNTRIYGQGAGVRPLIVEITESIKRYEITGKTQDTQLELDKLNCSDENTITSTLIKTPWSKLFQVESNVNPLDEINHKRKISLMAVERRGGISADHSDPKPRSVNPSHMGRICPIESPEGENIGLVVHLAALAKLNENGIIEAPFFKIDKEKQTIDYTKAIYMDYGEEILYTRAIVPKIAEKDFAKVKITKKGVEIAEYELEPIYGIVKGKPTLMNLDTLERAAKMHFNQHPEADLYELKYGRKDWFIEPIIDCMEGEGHPVKRQWDEIDYVTCRGEHILSAVTGNIPFAEYDDGTRLMMGAAMSKQTEAVVGSAPPLVKTPLTDKIGIETSGAIIAPFDCEVMSANSKMVTISSLEGDRKENIVLEESIVTSEKTVLTNVLRVKPGDVLMKGDVIADTDATRDGVLQIGTNLLVAYIPWGGYNYEDAIVISDKLMKQDILTSYRAAEYEFNFSIADDLYLPESGDVTQYKKFKEVCDERGIIALGTHVKRDDILAVKVSKSNQKKTTVIKHEGESEGVVVRIDEAVGVTAGIKRYTIVVASKEKINIGDKLAGRHGNKGVISRILPQWEMPRLEDGTPIDIILTPLGIPSRMNIGQLLEAQLGLILDDIGLSVTYDARTKVDVPKIKALTNCWTGDEEGKLQLYDGATGEPLMMKSTVGVTTIHKLKHLSSHKIYARGAGSPKDYTLEGHPTEGKKRGGGQRIGEMEYWSFQAHGAAQCLKELQTYKSDDPENRSLWKKNLRGDGNLPEGHASNIPKTYRMAVAELMSCGIDLIHLDPNGRELNIFEDSVINGNVKPATYTNRNSAEAKIQREQKDAERERITKENFEVEQRDREKLDGLFDLLDDDITEDMENLDILEILDRELEETGRSTAAINLQKDLQSMTDEERRQYFKLQEEIDRIPEMEDEEEYEIEDGVDTENEEEETEFEYLSDKPNDAKDELMKMAEIYLSEDVVETEDNADSRVPDIETDSEDNLLWEDTELEGDGIEYSDREYDEDGYLIDSDLDDVVEEEYDYE